MNPNLKYLHPYPFEKLASLKQGIVPPQDKAHISLSIGEPTHPTPHFIQESLLTHVHGLGVYPTTKGLLELRLAQTDWLSQRFQLPLAAIDPDTQVLPVNGTREALFSFAQCVIDTTVAVKPIVIMPNPFYQIYEGAALLAGAEPYFLNTLEETGYLPDFDSVPEAIWQRCQLIYICSPGNPSGAVMSPADHQKLINLAEQYDFIIASDECYSELYDDEANPPVSLLQSAYLMGNNALKRCIAFHSLSKRSNAPGLRSGFVAGDAASLQGYFQYRTYHGCAMALPTQHASIKAWQDEQHVIENRRLYREKFAAFITILSEVCTVKQPPASFYVWLKIPQPSASPFVKGGIKEAASLPPFKKGGIKEAASLPPFKKGGIKETASLPPFKKGGLGGISDTEFAQKLFAHENLTVLPGSFLSREFNGINPGTGYVRIALVAPLDECIKSAHRIKNFLNTLKI